MVQKLLAQGTTRVTADPHAANVAGLDPGRVIIAPGQFRPPQPGDPFDGEINRGVSHKFSNTELNVLDRDGKIGINASHVHEHAFLQLQL